MTPVAQDVASAGKIHLLDIHPLKERFGSKWSRIAQHVHKFFEAAIRRALKPGDTFFHFEELSYLIMFRDVSAVEAEFKCKTIAQEVCTRIFGDNKEHVSLRSLVARVDPATTVVGAEQAAELSAFLEREGVETIVASNARPVASPRRRVERMLRLGSGSAPRLHVSSRDIVFAWRPIWDASNSAVLTYLCQPLPPASLGPLAMGLCTAEDEAEQALLDCLVLDECVMRARLLRGEGRRIILAVPVHFTTVAHPRVWREYCAGLQQLSDGAAGDFAFVVFGIDHGVPHVRLTQELPKLSRMAYRVFCVIDRCRDASARFARTGARGIGMVLDERDEEQLVMARLQELAKEARAATIDSFVLGLRSSSLLLSSIHSGVRYLEGPAVRPATDDPRHGFAQGVEDIYKAKRLAL